MTRWKSEIERAARRLALAVTSLTVLPIPVGPAVSQADLAASRWAFPIVGLGLGLLLATISWRLDQARCSSAIAGFLVLATWVVMTGGLHIDGLADSADGLFLAGGRERRLGVMKDPQVGSFGVIALILVLLGKYAALGNLVGIHRFGAIVLAATTGRSLILVVAGLSSYARPQGTGRVVIEATKRPESLFFAIATLLFGVLVAGSLGLMAVMAAILVALGLVRLADRRIGGLTGDILGAVVELGEWAVLTTLGWRSGI